MEDDLQSSLAGSVGLFWPDFISAPEGTDPLRGHLVREQAWVTFQALDERDVFTGFGEDQDDPPSHMAGLSPLTSIVLLEIPPPSWTSVFGGYRASTRTYRARTAIGGVPIDRLKTHRLSTLEAQFLGITWWAGQRPIETSRTTDEDGRIKTLDLHLGEAPAVSARLSRGRDLTMSSTWSTQGGEDTSTIYAPITFTCSARRPVEIIDLLVPLLRVQDLLNLAYSTYLHASGGAAGVDLRPPDDRNLDPRAYPIWNGALMNGPPGFEADDRRAKRPAFGLLSIGGVAGISRWVGLTEKYDRATSALTDRYRLGPASSVTRLREVANAIEYWVSVHRRTTAWARLPPGTKNPSPVKALARHVGPRFRTWVGNADVWAEEFWDTYNAIKHDPAFVIQHGSVADLATSGHALLSCALLNRAARTKTPTDHILGTGPNLHNLGMHFRSRYG